MGFILKSRVSTTKENYLFFFFFNLVTTSSLSDVFSSSGFPSQSPGPILYASYMSFRISQWAD